MKKNKKKKTSERVKVDDGIKKEGIVKRGMEIIKWFEWKIG